MLLILILADPKKYLVTVASVFESNTQYLSTFQEVSKPEDPGQHM